MPYNFIYAYGVPPDGMDELSDFDDFVKLLMTHEFTHVVHLDTILSWCPRLVDPSSGKIYAPNLSQPTWFIEGLAVLMESRQTTAGRLRSSFHDMHLRVPFLEERVLGLDAVTSGSVRSSTPAAASPTCTAAACSLYRDRSARPRSARSRSATRTSASQAASTAPRAAARPARTRTVRQRHRERLEAL